MRGSINVKHPEAIRNLDTPQNWLRFRTRRVSGDPSVWLRSPRDLQDHPSVTTQAERTSPLRWPGNWHISTKNARSFWTVWRRFSTLSSPFNRLLVTKTSSISVCKWIWRNFPHNEYFWRTVICSGGSSSQTYCELQSLDGECGRGDSGLLFLEHHLHRKASR